MSLKTNNIKVTDTGAVSAHVSDTESNLHGVGIFKLHVLIVPDGRFWFAQGFEVDYSVQGDTVEDAKSKFSKGLRASIHHHLTIFGCIDGLQRVVPNDIWRDLWEAKARAKLTYSCVSIHEIVPDSSMGLLPFDGIEYAVESQPLAA